MARHLALEPLPVNSQSVSRPDEEKDLFVDVGQSSPATARFALSIGRRLAGARQDHTNSMLRIPKGPKLSSAVEILGLGSDADKEAWERFVEREKQAAENFHQMRKDLQVGSSADQDIRSQAIHFISRRNATASSSEQIKR